MKKSSQKFDMKTLKRLIFLLKEKRGAMILSLVLAFISVILTLYVNVEIGHAVDFALGKGKVDFAGIGKSALIIAGCVIISAVCTYIMTVVLDRIAFFAVKKLRNCLFEKLQNTPVSYLDKNSPGDIISRLVNDIEQISDGLIMSAGELFTGVVSIAGTLVFMFVLNWQLAIVVSVATPLTLVGAKFIADSTYRYFKKQSAANGDLSGTVEEDITGISVIKSFGREEETREKFEKMNETLRVSGIKAVFFSSTVNPTTRLMNGIIYAAVGVLGAIIVINSKNLSGGLTIGLLSSFLAYANQFSKPFNEISGVLAEFQGALSGAVRVFEVLDEPDETEKQGALEKFDAKGNVKIDNVNFSYNENTKLIENFSANIKPGMRVAIVGPTGCGKTTFINLLMRFYDVNSGCIKYDGTDARNITRDAIHENYGMVLQDTWLRHGTIRDNIAMARPDATEEEIRTAAKNAYAHHFILRLEKGYDTVISNEDTGLSYGQKQLICIARLMLALPPMLILDEATSSIDTRTEIRVQQGFGKMMQGRTSFVVAHRLSTIKNSDLIIVMRDGKITEQGSHGELLEHKGFYHELWEAQGNRI